MPTFQGTDFGDLLKSGAFPIPSITKDGQVLNPLIMLQPSDLAGNDNIILLGGADVADGGAGNDTIDAGAGNDNPINGGDGNDSIILGAGNDNGFGDEGDDTLFGGLGINNVDGGNGNDYLSYLNVTPTSPTGANQVVVNLTTKGEVFDNAFVSLATDNIIAIENVIGAPGLPNNLTGTTGDNILIGGAASDAIASSGGKDTLKAGLGDDFYTVLTTSNGSQIEDTGGTADSLFIPGVTLLLSGPSTTGYGLERQGKNLTIDLDLDGKIDLTKDLLIVDFYADTTSKTAGTGFIENVVNLKGEDILNATNIPNTAPPPTSNVTWTTPTASISDPGPAVPAPAGGNTTFVDQGITSYVFTNAADNTFVPATAANLYIQALNGSDFVVGTASVDNINGNLGNDQILAGGGNDGDRTLILPANTIRTAIRGGKGSDNLDGQEGDDLLNGNLDNDTVLGGVGNDILRGGKGADVLDGGAGADYLIGDADQDKLTGGADADIFVLPGTSVAATSANQADLITDFLAGTDKIMLPAGITFAQLTLTAVTIQVDGGTALASTSIQSGTSFYGLVQGITPVQLTETNFIADDPNITVLG